MESSFSDKLHAAEGLQNLLNPQSGRAAIADPYAELTPPRDPNVTEEWGAASQVSSVNQVATRIYCGVESFFRQCLKRPEEIGFQAQENSRPKAGELLSSCERAIDSCTAVILGRNSHPLAAMQAARLKPSLQKLLLLLEENTDAEGSLRNSAIHSMAQHCIEVQCELSPFVIGLAPRLEAVEIH